ncbi:MAG TPA: alkaline phosphatase family protein [Chloroflexota bacterium]|nr:alkaline phosphatase family protein [Chloroflexota bacterium]
MAFAVEWNPLEAITPDYGGACLLEVPRAIVHGLGGAPTPSGLPAELADPLRRYRHLVLLVLDGFGWNLALRLLPRVPLLRRFHEAGVLLPGTTVFPSSTAAALTSLASGQSPALHSIYEWWIIDRHWGQTIQSLPYAPADSPDRDVLSRFGGYPAELFDGPTIFQELKAAGVACRSFLPTGFQHQTYSRATHAGSEFTSYSSLPALLAAMCDAIRTTERPALSYVYWSEVDSVSHRFGPDSEEAALAGASVLGLFAAAIAQLPAAAAQDVGVLLLADHGHLEVDQERVVRLNDCPEVTGVLARNAAGARILPAGGPRCVFLDVEQDGLARSVSALRQRFEGTAEVLEMCQAIDRGLFGPDAPSPRFLERAGNVLLIAQQRAALWYQYSQRAWNYRGLHGALSASEVVIPLGLASLADLIGAQ